VAVTVELSTDDVSRLAGQANVEDDVIREVAPELEQQSVWSRSLNHMKSVYEQTPEEIRSNVVGVACELVTGEITTQEEFAESIRSRFQGATQEEEVQLALAIFELGLELDAAAASADPQERAAAVLTCFTAEQLTG
jgi:hypothetical protein